MYALKCDVHTHTLFSRHAYSTVEEDVRAARDQGLELLGITDHFSNMLFDEQSIKNFQYFINTVIWPREWYGIKLLHGCEADIVDLDGRLFGHDIMIDKLITDAPMKQARSLSDMVFACCDYIVASVHDRRFTQRASVAENTRMYIKALEHPKVMILGHVGRSSVDFELDPVLEAARDLGKLIEINETSLKDFHRDATLTRCHKVVERAAELGCSISFGSDAHISWEIGKSSHVQALLEELSFPEELVSCSSAARFMSCYEKLFGPLRPTGKL